MSVHLNSCERSGRILASPRLSNDADSCPEWSLLVELRSTILWNCGKAWPPNLYIEGSGQGRFLIEICPGAISNRNRACASCWLPSSLGPTCTLQHELRQAEVVHLLDSRLLFCGAKHSPAFRHSEGPFGQKAAIWEFAWYEDFFSCSERKCECDMNQDLSSC